MQVQNLSFNLHCYSTTKNISVKDFMPKRVKFYILKEFF